MNPILHEENLKAFRYILSLCDAEPSVWAAWGAIIEKRDYLPSLIRDFVRVGKEYGARWYSCGKISKKGHPHHPLYLPTESYAVRFDIDGYLQNLEKRAEKKEKRQAPLVLL